MIEGEGEGPPAGASSRRDILRTSGSVAIWTLVSRSTGLIRAATVAATLGPSFFGNLFQSTNTLPNLVFEMLTGALFVSLLVPVLVPYFDTHDLRSVRIVSGTFLTLSTTVFLVAVGLAVTFSSVLVRLLTVAVASEPIAAAQQSAGRILLALLMPQVLLYGIIGCAIAVQNARGRFGLPAALPAIENVITIAVLVSYAIRWPGISEVQSVSVAQLLWLGLGATGAVLVHSIAQWVAALRCGVAVLPRFAFAHPDVVRLVRLGLPSLAYASLNALRMLGALVVSSGVAGGVVGFQLAYNFYSLFEAIVARPVSQATLPAMTRAVNLQDWRTYAQNLFQSLRLALFIGLPACAGLLLCAPSLAMTLARGNMNSAIGVSLIMQALSGLSAGALLQVGVYVLTNAYYAQHQARMPFLAVTLRSTVAISIMFVVLRCDGPETLLWLGLVISGSDLLALLLLGGALAARGLPGEAGFGSDVLRIVLSTGVMVAVLCVVRVATRPLMLTAVEELLCLALTGLVTYLLVARSTKLSVR